ncbi:hypothetical protein [Micromonospora sp. DT62]|uniref:hypothetical protein n=1 Tax=Micromonospora sp. DT62 TaxID=3416521 RepID=UPI003CEA8AD2
MSSFMGHDDYDDFIDNYDPFPDVYDYDGPHEAIRDLDQAGDVFLRFAAIIELFRRLERHSVAFTEDTSRMLALRQQA